MSIASHLTKYFLIMSEYELFYGQCLKKIILKAFWNRLPS